MEKIPKIQCQHWLIIAYTAPFSTLLSRLTALACGSTWVTGFIARFFLFLFYIHQSGVPTALAWLVPHETAAVSAQVLCTPYNHTPCHFMQSHILKVYACLAVACHLHFWQNDQDHLCATEVTLRWNRYWNKSQHRKSTLENKILPPLQQGFEPATFQSRVRRSNHWAIPAPPPSITVIHIWDKMEQKIWYQTFSWPPRNSLSVTHIIYQVKSKHIKGSKECCLLEQNTTCKFSG